MKEHSKLVKVPKYGFRFQILEKIVNCYLLHVLLNYA